MANNVFIVVEDPKQDYWEGSLVESTRAGQLRARGVSMLPVVPDLFRRAAIGGFHKRAWGAGVSLDSSVPKLVAPMTMYCVRELPILHWCAKLIVNPSVVDKKILGTIQIAADISQVHAHKCGVTPDKTIDLGSISKSEVEAGVFVVGGTARASIPLDAVYGFALYGMAPGVRVAWGAVSQAPE